jgi:hypothetical protein
MCSNVLKFGTIYVVLSLNSDVFLTSHYRTECCAEDNSGDTVAMLMYEYYENVS